MEGPSFHSYPRFFPYTRYRGELSTDVRCFTKTKNHLIKVVFCLFNIKVDNFKKISLTEFFWWYNKSDFYFVKNVDFLLYFIFIIFDEKILEV
ncbi:hypothetical protein COU48_01725 [Candidatus Nomurabacteria bacterium CG10_big_fil_rev_8_21_14_0_10_03_31_7]|uniref:Uncharacterized protein n=1 Tax=Candidatus Nomurabacteria bacterium CG10_big_fil_rev_8_21_14_0_10_03_31_7 TaxID=1974730 RepID=A0A2J0JHV5_9BACT|nr:MAG: hypothetical protein COU48_01725 [Candidatus Nomurabacteria bacterium CG10_big_fil_rev_8_21_14_0_10_03_31_7]